MVFQHSGGRDFLTFPVPRHSHYSGVIPMTGNIIISSNDEPDEPDEPGHLPKKGTAFRQFQIRGSEHLPKGEPEYLW